MLRLILLASMLSLVLIAASTVSAQTVEDTADSTQVEQQNSAPPKPARDAGVFSRGRIRGSLILGWASAFDNSYLLLGVGGGYFLANGLDLGLELLSWLGQDPTMLQITPELRYVFWQPKRFHPYLGAFFRHTLISDWPDQQSVGGRFGLMYRSGKSYVGIGGVYSRALDCDDSVFKCDTVYPEVFFAMFW